MIKIDIEMPESCSMCPFELYSHTEDKAICVYSDIDVTQMVDCRDKNCPLKEGEAKCI